MMVEPSESAFDNPTSWKDSEALLVIRTQDNLQQIKNEYVGEHVTMVEYFPPNDELINEVNRRHLWSTNDVIPM